jgi:NHLM bacteriocin system ABC transporter ATP-binding protein
MSDEALPVPVATAPPPGTEALFALFESLGETYSAEGHQPFLIDQAADLWMVTQGEVHLFVVSLDENRQAVGARKHFASFKQGDVFHGMDFSSFSNGFLAAGTTGARVSRADETAVFDAADGEGLAQLASALERWVASMSTGVTRDMPHRPKPNALADMAGAPTAQTPRQGIISTRKQVMWVQFNGGDFLFLGSEEVFFPEPTGMLPLAPDAWIESFESRDVGIFPAAAVLAAGSMTDSLVVFHQLLCTCEFINKRLGAVDEFHRLKTKSEYQLAARRSALAEIAAVLDPKWAELADARGTESRDHALLTVARLVGTAIGAQVRPNPGARRTEDKNVQLLDIAKASRLRVRDIALRDEWWRMDNGPFIAFIDATNEPCAAIPDSPEKYSLINGATGEKVTITPEVAASLHPIGKTLYVPFPDGKITPWVLMKYGARGLKPDILRTLLMGVILGMMGMAAPYFTGQIFESVIPAAQTDQLTQMCLALIAVAIGTASFELVRGLAVARIESKMDYSIQSALWDRLIALPLGFFRDYTTGDLANRAYGIDSIRDLVSKTGVTAILGMFTGSFYLFQMLQFNMSLGLAGIGLSLVAAVFTGWINMWQLSYQRNLYAIIGKITSTILQFISGVAKIRVSGSEDHAFKVWASNFIKQRRVSWTVGRISNISATFNRVFPLICSLVLFRFMQSVTEAAEAAGQPPPIKTGDFIAFNAAFGAFLGAVLQLSGASLSIFQVVPIFERFKPILVAEPEVDEAKSYPGELTGDIEIYNVNFRYRADGAMILKNCSIKIKPGQFVAFVGPSGSGKSTLLRVLMGFEKPESGKVYYDGQDLDSLDIREVRQQIGVVLQTSRLMPTDIYRNIIGNNTSITIERAQEAAAAAGLDDDIKKLPMGMHTVVAEGGGGFSGGQKQRLMIARAVVNRPRIMYLDEATSALDNRSQAIVTQSLDRLQATRVVVAHRLSTIMNADMIVVLVDGRVVETGNFKELMSLKGHFSELASRQIA